jgi:predicted nucleic acid-binding protein
MKNVLVDTSVWVDHFRNGNPLLVELLALDRVMSHPMILGEIACGTPPERNRTLRDIERLQQPRQATVREVMTFVERERLYGMGCGLVDLLLLTSAMITPGIELWTRDKRLAGLAERFGVRHLPVRH